MKAIYLNIAFYPKHVLAHINFLALLHLSISCWYCISINQCYIITSR